VTGSRKNESHWDTAGDLDTADTGNQCSAPAGPPQAAAPASGFGIQGNADTARRYTHSDHKYSVASAVHNSAGHSWPQRSDSVGADMRPGCMVDVRARTRTREEERERERAHYCRCRCIRVSWDKARSHRANMIDYKQVSRSRRG
jgi:hypothetical protein